jgi:hypothetical protein
MPTKSATARLLDMPKWKHQVLRAVAWFLGYRDSHVFCIIVDSALNDRLLEKDE